MHDLHTSNQILKLVLDQAVKNGWKKVTKIKIELGKIEEHGIEIRPENLRFWLKKLGVGTKAQGAKVEAKRLSQVGVWRLVEIEGEKE